MSKYKKWIISGLGVWLSLYSIFWATSIYGYTGFLVSILAIGAIVIFLWKFWKGKQI